MRTYFRLAAKAGTLIVLAGTLAACGGAPVRPPVPAANAAILPTEVVAVQPAPEVKALAPQAIAPVTAVSAATAEPTLPAPEALAVADDNSIFFASVSAQIDVTGEAKMRRHAAWLKDNPRLIVTLVGHTDNLGSTAYNVAIAEQRAAAVARKLQAMGVGRGQIRYYGVGDEKAGLACKTAGCRQKRRRVDLVYLD